MVLEAARHQPLAGREQRRGERVAGKAGERTIIESRAQQARPIDEAAGRQAAGLFAGRRSAGPARSWRGAAGSDAERPRLERLDAEDLVIARVAGDHEPGLAGAVVPKLAMGPGRVVAKIDVGREALERVRRLRIGTLQVASPR